ncbi:unnamed protein product [Echinostoma caproni]|uniref:Uncharacterized protein n=1 Tax=Echinostoma caproni TaxID=27848 RepID=A0A183BG12_9TREM|nr:unnamed protein product [Echinostoma caproni]
MYHCTALQKCKTTRFEERLAADAVQAPKQSYAYLRRRIKPTPDLPTLAKDGALAEKDEDKAEMLASYYASMYASASGTLIHLLDTDTALKWAPLTIGEVALELRQLKVHHSPGPDVMHPLILKELAEELAASLCNLFSLSFTQVRLPRQWKDAAIVPLPKVGDRSAPGNYRPVSLNSVAGKVVE